MSFSENDYPGLLAQIESTLNKYDNPQFTVAVIKKTIELAKAVPLYPGIASMCAGKMVQEKKIDEIKSDDRILVELKNGSSVYGKVESTGDILKISDSEVKTDDISKILMINENILEEDWPTLIFPEVE